MPWSMSLRKIFLTYFLMDEIMMIFLMTEMRLRSCGDVVVSRKRDPPWLAWDLLNLE